MATKLYAVYLLSTQPANLTSTEQQKDVTQLASNDISRTGGGGGDFIYIPDCSEAKYFDEHHIKIVATDNSWTVAIWNDDNQDHLLYWSPDGTYNTIYSLNFAGKVGITLSIDARNPRCPVVTAKAEDTDSQDTTLTINNKTSRDMTITISGAIDRDWNGSDRPDQNFDNVTLRAGESLTKLESVNTVNSSSAKFYMTCAFPGAPSITFQSDQRVALASRFQRDYTPEASLNQSEFRCFQRAGGNRNQFDIVERATCLSVMSWNVDKDGMQGDGSQEKGVATIVNAFGTTIPVPDVLLLQETDLENIELYCNKLSAVGGDKWEWYGMNEDGRESGNANVILSRYPIQDKDVYKFENQCGYGGRNAVWAEIVVPHWGRIRVYSVHLESGKLTDWAALTARPNQWYELAKHADIGIPVIIGGDFNGMQDFGSVGYLDCHQNQTGDRNTCDAGVPLGWQIYDFLLTTSRFVWAGNIYPDIVRACGMISDHYPIVASKFF